MDLHGCTASYHGKGKNVDFKKHRQRQPDTDTAVDLWNPLTKKSHQKEMLKTLLEVQLPCWSQPLAPMGMGSFFRHVVELLDEKNCFPLQGKAFFTENQIPFWGNFHHQRIESVLVCSGIHGCVSKLKGPQKSRGVCENDTFPGLLLRAL